MPLLSFMTTDFILTFERIITNNLFSYWLYAIDNSATDIYMESLYLAKCIFRNDVCLVI